MVVKHFIRKPWLLCVRWCALLTIFTWGFVDSIALYSLRWSEGTVSLKHWHMMDPSSLYYPLNPKAYMSLGNRCWTCGNWGRKSQRLCLLLSRGDRPQLPHAFLVCLCCKYSIIVVDLFMQCLPVETQLIWFRHLEWNGNTGPADLWAEGVGSWCQLFLGEPLSFLIDPCEILTLWCSGGICFAGTVLWKGFKNNNNNKKE